MHTTPQSAHVLATELKELLLDVTDVDWGVCPPALSIPTVAETLTGTNIACGAQNAHWELSGAYTGELSVEALRELGCSYVIIGHSERRHVFGESDEMIAMRLHRVADAGLLPILCVGEKEEEREQGLTEQVLEYQLNKNLAKVDTPPPFIAYEPVWAIGTGKRAEVNDVEAAHRFIRKKLAERFTSVVDGVRILYGGSVKPENVQDLAVCEEFDGALVGGASLVAASFAAIALKALERRKF